VARTAASCLLLLFAAATASATGIPRVFDAPWMGFDTGSFGEGLGPGAMAAGDLDADGDVDVLVGQSYFSSPGVSVLRNHGDGTFDRPAYSALPWNDSVGRVALSDVDGDGDLDALATIPDTWGMSARLGLWRNDGCGSLLPVETFQAGPGPVGLAVADFDGDGHDDVVTADSGYLGAGTTVSLLRHDGQAGPAAGFTAPEPFTGGASPLVVRAGDLDGDGDVDLAVAREGASGPVVTILVNDGTGGFTVRTNLGAGPRGAPTVALSDLDVDGDLDVVTSWLQNDLVVSYGVVRVFRNGGGASFTLAGDHRLDDYSDDPVDIAIGDLDGDGFPDVLTANANGRSVEGWRALLGNGAGGLQPVRAYPSSQNTEGILASDLDDDGDLDVLTLAHFSAALTVHRNPGSGLFGLPAPHPVSDYARGLDAADVDGDGDLDLAVADGAVELLGNEGDGSFAPAITYVPAGIVSDVKLCDLDGDTDPDVLTNTAPGGGFSVGLNLGTGTFAPPVAWTVDPCSGGKLGAFDLDADGDLDVVMSGCAQGFGGYLMVARNAGDATFTAAPRVPTLLATTGVAAARVDGDGVLDLVANVSGYGLGTYLGNGDLTFGPESVSGPPPYLFAVDDFDGDAFADAAVVIPADSFGTDMVGIARGLGDGFFAEPVLTTGSSVLENLRLSIDLDVADVDCDGRVDLVVTGYASNDLGVFRGNGDGTIGPHVRYGANITPSVSHLADVTGDGKIDAVTSSQVVGPPAVGRSVVVLPALCGCSVASPEVDNRSLRVKKVGASRTDVEVAFDDGSIAGPGERVNVYRGSIDAFRSPSRYDHGRVATGCELLASPLVDPGEAATGLPDRYYLAVHRCRAGAAAAEGSYGNAFDGRRRPRRPSAAADSGNPCP
jgi:hypothetical protein